MKRPTNGWQRAVCKTYGGGDVDHFADDENWRDSLEDCGDALFRFLMIELADKEDCDSAQEALRRLMRARDDIDGAIAAVAALIPIN